MPFFIGNLVKFLPPGKKSSSSEWTVIVGTSMGRLSTTLPLMYVSDSIVLESMAFSGFFSREQHFPHKQVHARWQ